MEYFAGGDEGTDSIISTITAVGLIGDIGG